MRKWMLLILALPLCLFGCERETLTDPVLFCRAYNSTAPQPIREEDAFLRTENEVLLYSGETLVRLLLTEEGAIHTAVVTGYDAKKTAAVAQNAFSILTTPFSETVPKTVQTQMCAQERSVQTAETKRFFYAVFRDGEAVTAVQINRLLSSIPVLPSLRPSGSE